MKTEHYEILKKHDELLTKYPQIRSFRDASSEQTRELAAVSEDITGQKPNLACNTCIDEMLMDLSRYYKNFIDAKAKPKPASSQKAGQKK